MVCTVAAPRPPTTTPHHHHYHHHVAYVAQQAIRTEPNWKKYVLPLKDFMLVVRGFEGERTGEIVPERIASIGFLMAEVRAPWQACA